MAQLKKSAKRKTSTPTTKPITANRIFMPMNQRHPSKSKVKIKPGILILHVQILMNMYPTKLFAKKQQDMNVKREREKKIAIVRSCAVSRTVSHVLMVVINAKMVARVPHTKDRVLLLRANSRVSALRCFNLD